MIDEIKKTYLRADIKTIIALIILFVIIIVFLYTLNIKTNYLVSLAVFLMGGTK